MWEILENMLETFMNNLEIWMPILWVCFAVCITWFITSAKHCASLTRAEARLLWKIHKQDTQCNSRKWREIRRRGRIVGFECECGYKHVQKRPIV